MEQNCLKLMMCVDGVYDSLDSSSNASSHSNTSYSDSSCNIPNFKVSRVNYLNLLVMSLRGYLRKDKEFRELK